MASDMVIYETRPGSAPTLTRPLTRHLELADRGLAVNATQNEEWRPVPGHEGSYEVSSLGRVRSLNRTIVTSSGVSRRILGRVLRPVPCPTGSARGYMYVSLGRGRRPLVHRIVSLAFLGEGDVLHRNGNRSDNRVDNLRVHSVSPIERMWDKTRIDPNTGCWIYEGRLHRGYGQVKHQGRTASTHRVSYRMLVDPRLPEDLTIDHVAARGCRSKACWNPTHLEAVTTQENTRRRDSELERSLRPEIPLATHCLRGHERTGSNVEKNGNCRACANELRRERRARARLIYTSEELTNE